MKDIIEIILALFSPKKKAEKKESKVDKKKLDSYIEEVKDNKLDAKFEKPLPKLIEFDEPRDEREFKELASRNPELHQAILEANIFAFENFKKNLVVTMVFRTQAEQDYLYKNNARYKKKPFKSPHQFWHAVDLRSRTFTADEISRLEDFLNRRLNPKNYYRWTAKNHTVGHGVHFHVQYVRKKK